MLILHPAPLTQAAFAPYGEVIETRGREFFMINSGSTRRYHRLAEVQLSSAADQAIISIFRAQALAMPIRIRMLERHPLGSQAFIPLKGQPFLILVAEPGENPAPEQLRAFLSDGTQGVNYHRNVWHHPLLCCAEEDDFLVVDRAGSGNNCDEYCFADQTEIWLDSSATVPVSGTTRS
ncbi:MAG: ureidoglycolate lyase [Motiliproteus sp.]